MGSIVTLKVYSEAPCRLSKVMAFELVLEGQGNLQEMVIVAPGEEAMKAKARKETHLVMFRGVLMVRVAGGLGPWLVQWETRPEGKVKATTCQVCQA